MGLPQRPTSLDEASTQLKIALEKELAKGYVGNYGREYLFRHLRATGIQATRTRAFAMLKVLGPVGVQNRVPTFRRNRDKAGRLEVPGPNYMWCVDGHLKFREYGIGTYAMIDAYSRYVVAVFVGTSVTTAVSVVKTNGRCIGKYRCSTGVLSIRSGFGNHVGSQCSVTVRTIRRS